MGQTFLKFCGLTLWKNGFSDVFSTPLIQSLSFFLRRVEDIEAQLLLNLVENCGSRKNFIKIS